MGGEAELAGKLALICAEHGDVMNARTFATSSISNLLFPSSMGFPQCCKCLAPLVGGKTAKVKIRKGFKVTLSCLACGEPRAVKLRKERKRRIKRESASAPAAKPAAAAVKPAPTMPVVAARSAMPTATPKPPAAAAASAPTAAPMSLLAQAAKRAKEEQRNARKLLLQQQQPPQPPPVPVPAAVAKPANNSLSAVAKLLFSG